MSAAKAVVAAQRRLVASLGASYGSRHMSKPVASWMKALAAICLVAIGIWWGTVSDHPTGAARIFGIGMGILTIAVLATFAWQIARWLQGRRS